MAAGILSEPGTEFGPCLAECQHTDCATSRAMAASICSYCQQPVGYGVRFYQVEKGYVHAKCHEQAVLDPKIAEEPLTIFVDFIELLGLDQLRQTWPAVKFTVSTSVGYGGGNAEIGLTGTRPALKEFLLGDDYGCNEEDAEHILENSRGTWGCNGPDGFAEWEKLWLFFVNEPSSPDVLVKIALTALEYGFAFYTGRMSEAEFQTEIKNSLQS